MVELTQITKLFVWFRAQSDLFPDQVVNDHLPLVPGQTLTFALAADGTLRIATTDHGKVEA